MCTKICGCEIGKNCSKTLLTELTMKNVPNKKLKAYCILDEQSNTTIVDEKVVQYFGQKFPSQEISMKFASQDYEQTISSKLVTGLQIKGVLTNEVIDIPRAVSCPNISDTTYEVATPDIVRKHPHLAHYAEHFPEFDPNTEVLILIGRDCGRAMATKCLSDTEPYIHQSPLGYSLVGSVCPKSKNRDHIILKTHLGRHTTGSNPLKESLSSVGNDTIHVKTLFENKPSIHDNFQTFETHHDDDNLGLSTNDKTFMSLMNSHINITDEGYIELPLPTKTEVLPDNKSAIYMRSSKTLEKLKSEPIKLEACLKSMDKSMKSGFVEEVPARELNSQNPTWHLPIFCVEQAKKSKFRLVYDASARYKGTSLNDVLLQGPDLNNQLRSVLLRFREEPVAFGADIESMYNNFKVPIEQKDLLRFFWYKDNNPENPIIQYRSTSHIFGCTSSPAVATYGLKYCASKVPDKDSEVYDYLNKSFYVDDGMYSTKSSNTAIYILSRTISLLKRYNLRLHKIVSNSKEVLANFPESEHASPITKLPTDKASNCSTLGVSWNTDEDVFIMNSEIPLKPFTKRGILSTNNSLYDPIGMSAPVSLTGKLLQREILLGGANNELSKLGWDDNLPENYYSNWTSWISSLKTLDGLRISRGFYPNGFNPIEQELHVFSDASEKAIGHVAYMRSINKEHQVHVAFVTASSKVAPKCATTIPRLELCAALEAARCASNLLCELKHKPTRVYMYCDSKIVLGYINNDQKRFKKYVENRINIIRSLTKKEQWHFVSTKENPADMACRPFLPDELIKSCWLDGPTFLWEPEYSPSNLAENLGAESLPEEKSLSSTLLIKEAPTETVFSGLFERVNNFSKLVTIASLVLKFINKLKKRKESQTPREDAIFSLVRQAQQERFATTISMLKSKKTLPESFEISKLNPQLDCNNILRVGGRLANSSVAFSVKHPILLPKNHPFSLSVALHYHKRTKHQGSRIGHFSIIQEGYFIENGRQLIRKLISNCVICRRLRGKLCQQLMADLPSERLEEVPPFTHVGIDVFGPFYIHDGQNTRRHSATKKIWALILVCLPSRAIHLEPLYGLDVSSFRNAFTRFTAIRGICRTIRSDQGTNFICAKRQMEESININQLMPTLASEGIQWILNPPHASHFSGAWERKIGSVRRVLEASILLMSTRHLSRDEFCTFLAESSAIVNNTPLWTSSSNPNDPTPLSPSMLLTLRDTPNPPSLDNFSDNDIMAYGSKRFRRVQYLSQQFWNRWRHEYLHTLTLRHKWKTRKPCISTNDIVLVKDKQLPRNTWPLGKVISTKQSKDGLVRSVFIKIPPLPGKKDARCINRAINDLVLLIPSTTHQCLHSAS